MEPHQDTTEHLEVLHSEKAPSLGAFLQYIVFEAHGLRIGLEIALCMLLYSTLRTVLPWEAMHVAEGADGIIAWFTACFLVGTIDQLLLCPAFYKFRQAYRAHLRGEYEKAMEFLEAIAPHSQRLITCPPVLYHQQRSAIFAHSERTELAFTEIEHARKAGMSREQYALARCYLFKSQGNIEAASEELNKLQSDAELSPRIAFARAMLLFEVREDLREAKAAFEAVLAGPNELHPSGEMLHTLATGFWEASRLWTGYAEDALDGLSMVINRIRNAALYVETLRPVLASLLVERAYYLATHREPEAALDDLRACYALCNYPHVVRRIEDVKDELRWRQDLAPAIS